jgi:hemerythrin-like domain-containing protein
MTTEYDLSRREMIGRAALAAGTALAATTAVSGEEQEAAQDQAEAEPEVKVTPPEDLTREHAVLSRLLLIYEKVLGTGGQPSDWLLQQLADAVRLVRTFVEDYHEKLEEDHIFPRFEKVGKLADLTAVLRKQHDAGRRLTDVIVRQMKQAAGASDTQALANNLTAFIRMYRPHAAREGTVLFPQISSVVKPDEYDEMGDTFEEIEHQKFGAAGFEGVVQKIAEIEKNLRIYDLASFTPKLT